jgi:hypothetical protein
MHFLIDEQFRNDDTLGNDRIPKPLYLKSMDFRLAWCSPFQVP